MIIKLTIAKFAITHVLHAKLANMINVIIKSIINYFIKLYIIINFNLGLTCNDDRILKNGMCVCKN